ncbi:MAG: VOC family protein [Pseudomonadota bacterium]
MIGYITLGSNDIPRAANFYDALLGEIGAKRFMESETFVGWSIAPDKPMIGITVPYNGAEATIGNGVMIALSAQSPADVDRLYAKAIELGGSDEGAPGDRGNGFYAAYFRDLDGNKLNFFAMAT